MHQTAAPPLPFHPLRKTAGEGKRRESCRGASAERSFQWEKEPSQYCWREGEGSGGKEEEGIRQERKSLAQCQASALPYPPLPHEPIQRDGKGRDWKERKKERKKKEGKRGEQRQACSSCSTPPSRHPNCLPPACIKCQPFPQRPAAWANRGGRWG